MTQTHLGSIIGRDAQTIARWEKGETPIDQPAEMILRRMALEHAGIEDLVSMEELSKRTVREAGQQPILIDASNPDDYRPFDLAA